MFSNWNSPGSNRRGRQSKFTSTLDPAVTQQALLAAYSAVNQNDMDNVRHRYSKFDDHDLAQFFSNFLFNALDALYHVTIYNTIE